MLILAPRRVLGDKEVDNMVYAVPIYKCETAGLSYILAPIFPYPERVEVTWRKEGTISVLPVRHVSAEMQIMDGDAVEVMAAFDMRGHISISNIRLPADAIPLGEFWVYAQLIDAVFPQDRKILVTLLSPGDEELGTIEKRWCPECGQIDIVAAGQRYRCLSCGSDST